jgi:hypothetical protein
MRLGFFKLMKPKEHATDWIWITDHIAPVGMTKCLIIYAVRLSSIENKLLQQEEDARKAEEQKAEVLKLKELKALKAGTLVKEQESKDQKKPEKVHIIPQDGKGIYLSSADLTPIAIVPMEVSNKELVLKELEKCVCVTGVPCAVLEDQGSDLKSGTEAFCAKYSDVKLVPDIKHKTALILKEHLNGSPDWEEFCQLASELKCQVQQTKLSYLAPISQRKISRYMNLEVIEWGVNTLRLLDNGLPEEFKADQDFFEKKFAWLRNFRSLLAEWKEVLNVANVSVEFIRKYGHFQGSSEILGKILAEISGSSQSLAHKVACDVLSFTETLSETVELGKFLPGSTEIIESMIGKYKDVVGEHSRWGITGAVLSMAAFVGEMTPQIIIEALETTRVKQVWSWCKEKLTSTLSKRRTVFAEPEQKEEATEKPQQEQKQDQSVLVA